MCKTNKSSKRHIIYRSLALVVSLLCLSELNVAEETTKPVATAGTDLTAKQAQVAEKFRELKAVLLRMAELTGATDPRRAALLRQAVAQANERGIDGQFEKLVELLREEQLS